MLDTKAIQHVFRLLDLPAEIRNKIYRYLLALQYVTRRTLNPAYHSSMMESEPIGSNFRRR